MKPSFGETLRNERIRKGLSQQQLADKVNVERSTIASWETSRRMPDFTMLKMLSDIFGIAPEVLLGTAESEKAKPVVIMVDNEKVILNGGIPLLKKLMPNAEILGFLKPSVAVDYAKAHKVALAFLDIELGMSSGLDLCRELIKINSTTNVVYLTAYMEYSFDAWATGACGFLLKPLSAEAVKEQLSRLRYPIRGLG